MVRQAGSTSKRVEPQELIVTEKDFEKLKNIRTTKRGYVTIYCKEINNMIENHGFRRGGSFLLKQALEAFQEGEQYTELLIGCATEDEEETEELLKKVQYQQLIEEAQEQVEDYQKEKENNTESEFSETRSRE